MDFPRAGDGHASDIDAMAAEIARGALSESDDEGAPDLYEYQLAAEVSGWVVEMYCCCRTVGAPPSRHLL